MKRIVTYLTLFCCSSAIAGHPYVDMGAGAVFSSSSGRYVSDSSSLLYTPTAIGTSFFTLPNVNWKSKFRGGADLHLSAGYQFQEHWRSEIEFSYQNISRDISGSYDWREVNASTTAVYSNSLDNPITKTSNEVSLSSLLVNGYYDFSCCGKWSPFIGGGLGVAWINAPGTVANATLNIDDPLTPLVETAPILQHSAALSGFVLAWQVKMGISYEFSSKTIFSVSYRLFGTSQLNAGGSYMISNPGTSAASTFYIAPHMQSGILTNAIDFSVRYQV